MTGLRPALLVALCVALGASAEARSFKWVDDKGHTHYGETIPPEYANRSNVELDDKGRVIKTQEVLTEEQRRLREEENSRKRLDDLAAQNQRRHDRMLLKNYSSEAEIDAARDRNLKQIEPALRSTQERLKEARQQLHQSRVERDAYIDSGRPLLPDSLIQQIAHDEGTVSRLEQELAQRQSEIAALHARAEADKQRYRELTGKVLPANRAN